MTAKTDLLPCPFCGGTEIHIGPMDQPNAWDYWVVGCNNYDCPLDADSVKVEFGTPEKAAAAWNTRATAANLAALQAEIEAQQQDKLDAERWRYIRRKLCLTGNGDGTCAMQAINLPAAIQGWPEPGQVAEFCDAAIDAAIEAAMSKENSDD